MRHMDWMSRFRAHPLLVLLLALSGCGEDSGREGASTGLTGASGVSSITGASGVASASAGSSGFDSDSDSGSATATGGSMEDCLDDDDCAPGLVCGEWSGQCLAPGACVYTEDCEEGQLCNGGECEIGSDCGASAFNLTKLPPNVMIVLDRSGSMNGDVQDSDESRWEVAKDAIFTLVESFNNDIRFGLVTYSACEILECTAGEIVVPVIDQSLNMLTEFLADKGFLYLCNSGNPETSTGNTLQALVGEPTLQEPARGNSIILITDGAESSECQGSTNGAQAAGDLYGQGLPVKTYAVGFSDNVIGSLADIALAGGTEVAYNANNPQSLEEALSAIAANVASCDYVLDGDPPDVKDIFVFFDDDPKGIPYDPVNGWTYDPETKTLHFHGQACEDLKSGKVIDIDVVYGCNAPIPG